MCGSLPVKSLSKRCWWFLTLFLVLTSVTGYVSSCLAADLAEVQKSFESFQTSWINQLHTHGDYGWEKIKVEKDAQGGYRATCRVVSHTVGSEVKPTGDKATPYVGVLKYEEHTFSSQGATPEIAKQGPFECDKQVLVTEIFRFSKGHWQF